MRRIGVCLFGGLRGRRCWVLEMVSWCSLGVVVEVGKVAYAWTWRKGSEGSMVECVYQARKGCYKEQNVMK